MWNRGGTSRRATARPRSVPRPLRDDARSYGGLSILNHWVLALGVIFLLVSGLVIAEWLTGAVRGQWIWWHKTFGVVATFWVGWMVLAHRLHGERPEPGCTAFEVRARHAMHRVLIARTLVRAVSGTAMSLFRDRGIDVFGLVTIRGLGEVPWLADVGALVHSWGGYLLLAAVLAHPMAALEHRFVSLDATLARMLGRRPQA